MRKAFLLFWLNRCIVIDFFEYDRTSYRWSFGRMSCVFSSVVVELIFYQSLFTTYIEGTEICIAKRILEGWTCDFL
jgi:hypothetical protein